MSIRSIDMMVLYSKLSDVEKMQQNEQQTPKIAQEQIAVQEAKRKELQQTQVMQSPGDEDAGRIKEEQERKRGNQKGRQEENQQEEETEDTAPKRAKIMRSGSIDIIA